MLLQVLDKGLFLSLGSFFPLGIWVIVVLSSFREPAGLCQHKEEAGKSEGDVLTVDEPDGRHGDGEEQPGAQVHLHQRCCQGKEQQYGQQAAQNTHRLGDAAQKGTEDIRGHQEQVGIGAGRRSWSAAMGAGEGRSGCAWPLWSSTGRLESKGWFSPLIQEGVEECEKQKRQLGQQRHPVVEVESVCGTGVVGAQGLGAAVGPCQPPLEVLPHGETGQGQEALPPPPPPSHLASISVWLKSVGAVSALFPAPGTQLELDGYTLD